MKRALVTGGLGFIGANLTRRLLSTGWSVTVFDNFSRMAAEANLQWLREGRDADHLTVIRGDVRDSGSVAEVVCNAAAVFHLAGQVAATRSIADPRLDFETNVLGTFNILEAARSCSSPPFILFTSTNKVYGDLSHIPIKELPKRYGYANGRAGIAETEPLDFYSPYGCSKGAADQYVRDYARIYGLSAVVFRMSAIYGPRQFGTEDQGWVAYFCIQALLRRKVGLYGVGKQVRDILYIDDLLNAFEAAYQYRNDIQGEVFNIGGGPKDTLSILELFDLLEELSGYRMEWETIGSRPGDQMIYVSDIGKARRLLDWQPTVAPKEGVGQLWRWIGKNANLFSELQ